MSADVPEPLDPKLPTLGSRSPLIRRFGRRGILLILLGSMWALIGYGFAADGFQRRFSSPAGGGPLEFLDTPPWPGFMWILGGVVALVSGLTRGVSAKDSYGFVGLTLPPFAWAGAYFWSWTTNMIFGPTIGQSDSWIGAVVFLAVVTMVLFLARWPDPDDPHLTRGGRTWSG